ncbi:MAG: CHASE2 domain-containing protein [Burkholderiaceae bacterium]
MKRPDVFRVGWGLLRMGGMKVWPVLRLRMTRMCVGLAFVALGVLNTLGVLPQPALEQLDLWWYDVRWSLQAPKSLDPRIVVVDIDEASLNQVGQWPWGRDRLAAMLEELVDRQGVALVGFDVLFAEPDGSSGLRHLEKLAAGPLRDSTAFWAQWRTLAPTLDFDARFARAIASRPVVLGYYFTSDRDGHTRGALPAPALTPRALRGPPLASTHWNGFGANLPELAAAAGHSGFFNAISDRDGVVRSAPVLAEFGGNYYESLSLAMLRQLLERPAVQPVYAQPRPSESFDVLRAVALISGERRFEIPVDTRLAVQIPFRGSGGPQGGSFRYIPAASILDGSLPPGSLAGTVVLVGSTAPGLQDLRVTPAGRVYPGVEVHANLLSGWLDGVTIVQPDYAQGVDLLQQLLLAGGLAIALPWMAPVAAGLATVCVVTGLAVANYLLFVRHGLALPVASCIAMCLVLFLLNSAWGYWVERRAKRGLAERFRTYVPPELVDEMMREPERYSMQARQAELTVMFCDMRGFTALSERMEPLALQQLLNRVFTRLSHAISRQRGTIDKYMGDCVMAFWGAPVSMSDHAERALAAALDMVAAVEDINREHQSQGLPAIGVGIGLHTGPMCVGDMGSDVRLSYTVIGDAVNLGSRLEGLCKLYGVSIVASQATRNLCQTERWMELDRVQVKGKQEPVQIFTPARPFMVQNADAPAVWHELLNAYRRQDWPQCDVLLARLRSSPAFGGLLELYAQRIQALRDQVLDVDWNGITRLDFK